MPLVPKPYHDVNRSPQVMKTSALSSLLCTPTVTSSSVNKPKIWEADIQIVGVSGERRFGVTEHDEASFIVLSVLDAAGEDVSPRPYFAAAALLIAADALLGSLSAIWAAQARGEEVVQRCVDLPTQAYLAVEDRGAKIRRDLWEKVHAPSRIEYALAGHSRRCKIRSRPFPK